MMIQPRTEDRDREALEQALHRLEIDRTPFALQLVFACAALSGVSGGNLDYASRRVMEILAPSRLNAVSIRSSLIELMIALRGVAVTPGAQKVASDWLMANAEPLIEILNGASPANLPARGVAHDAHDGD